MAYILYNSKANLDAYLRSLLSEGGFSLKQKGYVAPTVFLLQGKNAGSGWNYYNSLTDAFEKCKYLLRLGGSNIPPAGFVPLKKDGTAQTIGINVDFYFAVNKDKLVNLGYKARKFANTLSNPVFCILRFYKTDGTGPFYTVYDPRYMGASATPVSSYSADKISAIDRLNREVALVKAKHNVLASYLNALAVKKLTPVEQQIFNEGSLRLQTMRAEIQQINGIEIYYSKDGTIGFIVLPLIAWLIVGAAVVGWAVSKIVEQYQKTARLNASYDAQKWVSDQKIKIEREVTKGTLTKDQAAALTNDLDKLNANAQKNAEESAKNVPGMFGDIANVVKWAAIALVAWKGMELLGKSKSK